MTSLLPGTAAERPPRSTRWRAAAALTCGLVLVPAATAAASHQRMSDGTLCPHTAEAAAAPASPGQPAQPTRASSSAPLRSPGTSPGAGTRPAASQPASRAPAQRTVSRPASQVQAQQPATTASQAGSSSASAVSTTALTQQRARVATPRAGTPGAERPARRPTAAPEAARFATPVPDAKLAEPSWIGPVAPLPATRAAARAVAPAPDVVPTGLVIALSLLALGGLAVAAALRRRRRDSRAAVVASAPIAPSDRDALIEAELHEMIAEARARELLADRPAERDSTRHLTRTD